MAVSSVGGSSASSLYGSRNVLSGLASGMDTEAMIENMVMGTKNKITAQQQKQQKLLWKQEAYRSISDQLVQLSTKYTSYTSSTNLMSANFFKPSIITTAGKYKDLISASGSTTSDIVIQRVSQLAKSETITFSGLSGIDNTQSIDASKGVDLKGDVNVNMATNPFPLHLTAIVNTKALKMSLMKLTGSFQTPLSRLAMAPV